MEKDDIKKRRKILYITFRMPYPPEKGGYNLRAFDLGKILAEEYDVDLLTLGGKEEKKYLNDLKNIFNNVIFIYHPKISKYFNTFKTIFSSKPLQVGYYYSKKAFLWIKNNYRNYDLLFCSEIRTKEYLKDLRIKKCIDFVDAISLNFKEAKKYAPNIFWKTIYFLETQRLLKYEKEAIKKFDLCFITSQRDKDFILDKEDKKVIVLPNRVKEELLKREFKGKEEEWITFLGKMDYFPNEDASIFFIKEIFPKIKKEFPDIVFNIVGTSPSKRILKFKKIPGINITGFVKDPYFYLERSKLIVAPLRIGTGSQNKILEGMALKKTVITTPVSASGIPEAENNKHLIVVDHKKPKDFALKTIELLKDEKERKRIGENAKKLVLENYNLEKIKKILLDSLSSLFNDSIS